jgi:hypothetical protein
MLLADDGDNKALSPGRSRISRKAIAQGMSVCSPLHLYARVHFLYAQAAHETAGAARTRHSLRPLLRERDNEFAKLGRNAPRERKAASGVRDRGGMARARRAEACGPETAFNLGPLRRYTFCTTWREPFGKCSFAVRLTRKFMMIVSSLSFCPGGHDEMV